MKQESFASLVELLKEEFLKPLPGESAQKLMSPLVRNLKPGGPEKAVDPVPSGVLILLYQAKSGEIRFPLIQRPVYKGVHSGQVALPGGKKEPQDRSVVETALRESHEEIGVLPESVSVLGMLSPLYVWASNHIVTPVVGWLQAAPSFRPDDHEVAGILTADLNVLDNIEFIKKKELTVRDSFKIHAPYYAIDGQVVWGATAMMLSEFSVLLKNTGFFKLLDKS